jgi:catechol 2,3-dioxygenase-like lactoylglutathione lyase family enzyme
MLKESIVNFIAAIIVSAVISMQANTHTPALYNLQPTTVDGAFFALSVANVDEVSRWYQENLGLRVISKGEAPNKIARFAILEGNGVLIEIIQHSKAQTRKSAAPTVTDAVQIHGIFKLGLLVGDIDAVYTGLKKRQVAVAYDLMRAKDVPMRSFAVRDPEGNLVQFFGK